MSLPPPNPTRSIPSCHHVRHLFLPFLLIFTARFKLQKKLNKPDHFMYFLIPSPSFEGQRSYVCWNLSDPGPCLPRGALVPFAAFDRKAAVEMELVSLSDDNFIKLLFCCC